jgi:tetratricopeptide (TPR) repeat protein
MSAPAGGDKKNIVKMAYIYFQEGRWDKAIEEYKKLLALDPEDINTHNMLGDVYVKKGAVREAYEEYIKVYADFSARGQTDKASIVNRKIASLDSSLLPAEAQKKQSLVKQTLKAEAAMEQGNMDEAIEALNEVLKLDSENLTAFYKLAELFEKKGRIDEAVRQYQMLGQAFLKNRLYKKSQEMFQKVVQLEPANTEAHVSLAQIFIKQGSESDAKKEFLSAAEQALAADDLENADSYAAKAVELKSIEAHYVLGMVLFKKQKLSEAKVEFESLLRFKVNHVGALTHLGKVLLEMNQSDKAAEMIQKALKVEKDNLPALEAWVELCLKKGNKAEALQNLMALVDRYAEKGDQAKSAEMARMALSMEDGSVQNRIRLAEALDRTGDRKAAAEVYFKLALQEEKKDKKEQALEWFRKVLERDPQHEEALKRMKGQASPAAPAASPAGSPAQAPEVPVPETVEKKDPTPHPSQAKTAEVLDLEQDPPKPFSREPAAVSPPPATGKGKEPEPEPDAEEDWKTQEVIADNYIKQGLVEEAIEIYQKLLEEHPDHPELKKKLNLAYTAYVKTGEDVIGALEAEKKAKEEEEERLRIEMENKARQEAEKKARLELEKRAREEAEQKARAEMEKRAQEETLRKARAEAERSMREEMEKKNRAEAEQRAKDEAVRMAKEEADRKLREESERKVREESERRSREEAERRLQEEKRRTFPPPDTATSRTPPPSKGDSVLEEGRDDFMTIAVADIYVRQGLHEEAAKIYRRILQLEPDNLEARKKLADLEALVRSKGGESSTGEPPPPPPAPPSPPSHPPPSSGPDKDSGGKNKKNRVGYV